MIAWLVPALALAAASPAAGEADSIRRAIEKDRVETQEWLRSGATSYLATVQRRDFGELGTLRVGRAPDNEVRLDADSIAPHHLAVTVAGDSFQLQALDPEASFRTGGATVRSASVGPSSLQVGRFTLRLSHQRFPAIIVFDPRSPRLRDYKGLRYFPVDLRYRYLLPLTPAPRPDTVVILSTRGTRRRALRAGWFEFEVQGRRCRLEATRLLEPGVGEHDLGVFFRDVTSGKETYPMGRYLDAVRLPDGRYLLDFNQAYNPACAFSVHYNCPLPPKGNTLPVAIRAGEMDAHYPGH